MILATAACILFRVAATLAIKFADDGLCGHIYIRPSTIPGAGFGLFAGRDFAEGEVIDTSSSVQVSAGSIFGTQLHDFAFRSEHGPAEICLGSAMLCNHDDDANAELSWASSAGSGGGKGSHYSGVRVQTIAKRPIPSGAEITISYGARSWFTSRRLDAGAPDPDEAAPTGCIADFGLSNVYFSESKLNGAGNGVFSTRSFEKGSIIVVSPVLFLPKQRFLRSNLAGYLLSESDEEIALLPIGVGALMNHRSRNSNADVCWYDLSSAAHSEVCAARPDLLNKGLRSKNELTQNHKAEYFIAYIASSNIDVGDEITLNYGHAFNEEGRVDNLLRGDQHESGSSPIHVNGLFGEDFKSSIYKDTFREDALKVLTEMDIGELSGVFTSRIKHEL